jgi:hypothetical protein
MKPISRKEQILNIILGKYKVMWKRIICLKEGHDFYTQLERIDELAITVEWERCERCKEHCYISRIIY